MSLYCPDSAHHIVKSGGTSINVIVCAINAQNSLSSRNIITLIDGGANLTCIDADLAEELGLNVFRTETKTVHYLDQTSTVISNEVQFELVSQSDMSIVTLRGWTVKDLAIKTGCIDWYSDRKRFEYLTDIPFPSLPEDGRISVLIGTNYPGLFKVLEQCSHVDYLNRPELPIAVRYQLGWAIIGPNYNSPNRKVNSIEAKVPKGPKAQKELIAINKIHSE